MPPGGGRSPLKASQPVHRPQSRPAPARRNPRQSRVCAIRSLPRRRVPLPGFSGSPTFSRRNTIVTPRDSISALRESPSPIFFRATTKKNAISPAAQTEDRMRKIITGAMAVGLITAGGAAAYYYGYKVKTGPAPVAATTEPVAVPCSPGPQTPSTGNQATPAPSAPSSRSTVAHSGPAFGVHFAPPGVLYLVERVSRSTESGVY